MTEVHKGDRVRIQPPTVEGVVEELLEGAELVVATDDGRRIAFDDRHTVEVLERAQVLRPGTVKRSRKGQVVALSDDPKDNLRWVLIVGYSDREKADWFSDAEVADWPVIGTVPGTPAAEAQTPAEARPPLHVDNAAIAAGTYGEKADATEADWSALRDACDEYCSAYMGEDDTFMAPALDKIRAAIRGEDPYNPSASVREFPADGPEPPADVKWLEWTHPGRLGPKFLGRHKGGWAWALCAGDEIHPATDPIPWPPTGHFSFREVPAGEVPQ